MLPDSLLRSSLVTSRFTDDVLRLHVTARIYDPGKLKICMHSMRLSFEFSLDRAFDRSYTVRHIVH
jgi:hypothetical protein